MNNNNSNTIKVNFPVTGMTCKGCLSHVEKAIAKHNGIISSSVDLPKATATIEYDSSITTPAKIKQAVIDSGYDLIIE